MPKGTTNSMGRIEEHQEMVLGDEIEKTVTGIWISRRHWSSFMISQGPNHMSNMDRMEAEDLPAEDTHKVEAENYTTKDYTANRRDRMKEDTQKAEAEDYTANSTGKMKEDTQKAEAEDYTDSMVEDTSQIVWGSETM
jgi:hypothetical protein